MTEDNRRQHYRIQYPAGAGPLLETRAGTFPVLDLSETGLRFQASTKAVFTADQPLEASLALPEQPGRHKVRGKVIRQNEDGSVALQFQPGGGLPLSVMMGEQRRLIQRGALKKS